MTTKVQNEMLESGGGGGGGSEYLVENFTGAIPIINSGVEVLAVGKGSSATGDYGVVIGEGSATGEQGISIGSRTDATGFSSVAIGSSVDATGTQSVSVGHQSISSGNSATAVGSRTEASGQNSTVLGEYSEAIGYASVAIGSAALARSTDPDESAAVAIGGARSNGDKTIAIGYNAEVGDFTTHRISSVAIGKALVYADYAIAISTGTVDVSPLNRISKTISYDYSITLGNAEPTAANQLTIADGQGNVILRTGINGAPAEYADDAAAATGGVAIGAFYRTGSVLKVRVS